MRPISCIPWGESPEARRVILAIPALRTGYQQFQVLVQSLCNLGVVEIGGGHCEDSGHAGDDRQTWVGSAASA